MNFNFEEDFFREEIREDFRISPMMKKILGYVHEDFRCCG